MRSNQDIQNDIQDRKSLKAQLRLNNELLLDIRSLLMAQTDKGIIQPTETIVIAKKDSLNPHLHDLGICERTKTALSRTNIEYLNDLEGWTSKDLLKLRDFGQFALAELNKCIAPFGKKIPGA
jgi:DNA-directed RNA polymerase alpha subunit